MKRGQGLAGLLCCLAAASAAAQAPVEPPAASGEPAAAADAPDISDIGAAAAAEPEPAPAGAGQGPADAFDNIDLSEKQHSQGSAQTTRFTFSHELAARENAATSMVYNRSRFRFEYSRFFMQNFFVRVDTRLNAYWGSDNRARARDRSLLTHTNTPEAFVQYSVPGKSMSFGLGVQRVIWGESQGGAITDEVSPRNFSELFFIPLEESRVGQFMLTMDRFTDGGDYSFFYVPDAKYNVLPDPRTAYYLDRFGPTTRAVKRPGDLNEREFGGRWKRAFGRSDISIMAASLINNDYSFTDSGLFEGGKKLLYRGPNRFAMIGTAFNYVKGVRQWTGEIAYKKGKAYNDPQFNVLERDSIDASLGLTYSLGESNTVAVELVNSTILGWDSRIGAAPRSASAAVLNANFFFLNNDLSVNWLTIYNKPYTSYQSSLRTSYKWNDRLSFGLDLHVMDSSDRRTPLYPFNNQNQIILRAQYQF